MVEYLAVPSLLLASVVFMGCGSGDSQGGTDASVPDAKIELVSCDEREIGCEQIPPACEVGFVHEVRNLCWGDCVPIATCGCTLREECPGDFVCDGSQCTLPTG